MLVPMSVGPDLLIIHGKDVRGSLRPSLLKNVCERDGRLYEKIRLKIG